MCAYAACWLLCARGPCRICNVRVEQFNLVIPSRTHRSLISVRLVRGKRYTDVCSHSERAFRTACVRISCANMHFCLIYMNACNMKGDPARAGVRVCGPVPLRVHVWVHMHTRAAPWTLTLNHLFFLYFSSCCRCCRLGRCTCSRLRSTARTAD